MSRVALEYEVKVPITNEEEVRRNIIKAGGKLVEKRYEVDYYIDMRTCSNVPRDTVVRVRKVVLRSGEELGELTFKGERIYEDVKAREEISVRVSDPDKVVDMFLKLGFKVLKIEKEREVYMVGTGIKVCVDRVAGLGKFIEVEVMNPPSKEYFMSKLSEVLEKLSLQGSRIIVKSYLEMLLGGGG